MGWLAYPGVYLVYVLARGAVSGEYPYPFMDVKVLGYGGVFAVFTYIAPLLTQITGFDKGAVPPITLK